MTKDEFGKLLERRSKRLKAELTKLEEQLSALKTYLEKRDLLRERLWEKERQLSDPTGAPSIWKGELGYQLFLTVEDMRERTGCDAKKALTALRNIDWPADEEFSKLANYSVKELQVRYSEAKPHWESWREFLKEIDTEIAELRDMAEKIGPVMTEDEIRKLIHKDP
jgi:DNA repair exonuclease SbcCD ATPase subunit